MLYSFNDHEQARPEVQSATPLTKRYVSFTDPTLKVPQSGIAPPTQIRRQGERNMQANPSDPQIPLADPAVIDIKAQHNGELDNNGKRDWHWINFGRLRVEECHAAGKLSGYGRCTDESSIETPFLNPCDLEEHRFILLSGEIDPAGRSSLAITARHLEH